MNPKEPTITYAELEAAYESCIAAEKKPDMWIKDGYIYARGSNGRIVKVPACPCPTCQAMRDK